MIARGIAWLESDPHGDDVALALLLAAAALVGSAVGFALGRRR